VNITLDLHLGQRVEMIKIEDDLVLNEAMNSQRPLCRIDHRNITIVKHRPLGGELLPRRRAITSRAAKSVGRDDKRDGHWTLVTLTVAG